MRLAWLALAAALAFSPAKSEPVAIAVIDYDYLDTSGEPTDQRADHERRLAEFMQALRADLGAAGRLRVVGVACDRPRCTAADMPPVELIARAKQAGARLMLYGQIHKMSTLVQWANSDIVDLEADRLLESKLYTFRGDSDEAWRRAERFIAQHTATAAPPP